MLSQSMPGFHGGLQASRRLHRRAPASLPLLVGFSGEAGGPALHQLTGKVTDVCAYGLGAQLRATHQDMGLLRRAASIRVFLHTGIAKRPLQLEAKVAWIGLADDPSASRNAMLFKIGLSLERESRSSLLAYRKMLEQRYAAAYDAAIAECASGQAF